jgi:hypothetical protein
MTRRDRKPASITVCTSAGAMLVSSLGATAQTALDRTQLPVKAPPRRYTRNSTCATF